jgi:hypothetical protein
MEAFRQSTESPGIFHGTNGRAGGLGGKSRKVGLEVSRVTELKLESLNVDSERLVDWS